MIRPIESWVTGKDSCMRLCSAACRSSDQFAATIKADIAKYARIIKAAGIKADL